MLGGTWENAVNRNSGTRHRFRESSCDGYLCGFAHSVVNHFRRDLNRAFAGNEDDAAPIAAPHGGQIEPRQADAAQNIGIE